MESMMWVNKYHTLSSAWWWTWTTEVVSGALLRYVSNEASGFVRFSYSSAQCLRCFRIPRMCPTFVLIKIIFFLDTGGWFVCVHVVCIWRGNLITSQQQLVWPIQEDDSCTVFMTCHTNLLRPSLSNKINLVMVRKKICSHGLKKAALTAGTTTVSSVVVTWFCHSAQPCSDSLWQGINVTQTLSLLLGQYFSQYLPNWKQTNCCFQSKKKMKWTFKPKKEWQSLWLNYLT